MEINHRLVKTTELTTRLVEKEDKKATMTYDKGTSKQNNIKLLTRSLNVGGTGRIAGKMINNLSR